MNSISRMLTATGSAGRLRCNGFRRFGRGTGTDPRILDLHFKFFAGGGPPFSAIASFAVGGVFLATGQNDRALGGALDHPVSELHGSWQRIRGDRYGSTTFSSHLIRRQARARPSLLATGNILRQSLLLQS
jgi:hypothetical protein